MNTTARSAGVILLALLFAPAIQAQVAPVGVAATNSREAMKKSLDSLQVHSRYTAVEQLLNITVTDGVISGELLADLPIPNELYRVEVEGSPTVWSVRKRILGRNNNMVYITVARYDFDAAPDEFWSTVLTLRTGYFVVSATRGDTASGMRVRLSQANGSLSLTCAEITRGAARTTFIASAPTLRQLQAEHPHEVRQYLNPMLRGLTSRLLLRPGAADIYRVFDTIPPDPAAAKRLDDLLIRLESDDYPVRDKASRELGAIGAPAVLAVMRRDLSDLSAEAKNRLNVFLANHSNMLLDDPRAPLKDGQFLLDCLDDANPAVRAAAKIALEKLIAKPIEFDISLDEDARAPAVDALRKQFAPLLRPTTRGK